VRLDSREPLRIALDTTGLELDVGGSARAIVALRAELDRRDDLEVVALAHGGRHATSGWRRVLRGLHRELVYMPIQLPQRAARAGADLLHCPVGVAPVRSRVPLVVTVHDVMALEHPDWFTRANALQQRLVLPRALAAAARVIVPSGYTRERLVATLGVDAARIDVVAHGVGSEFTPGATDRAALERLGVEGPYVLTVGTLQPRKNLAAAVAAFERAAADGISHSLVVAGARGWQDDAVIDMLGQTSLRARIRAVGRVSDDELVNLYRGADCLLFPSLYEGFGFPLLEAMACGTPVVCGNRTSLPEVAGGAALLVDPDDTTAFAAALTEVLSSPARHAELVDAGLARARGFTWRRCADLTVAVYRRALGH
jgi:glycosyltransferase involved in cell wall biosynthesis